MTFKFKVRDDIDAMELKLREKAFDSRVKFCPLQVGDTITFPGNREKAYRVLARRCIYAPTATEDDWEIELELIA